MAWIELTSEDDAQGLLRMLYEEATARAGGVANIVKTMSPNPPVLQASMMLYVRAMKGTSGLSRREREMLATVVSRANDCFY